MDNSTSIHLFFLFCYKNFKHRLRLVHLFPWWWFHQYPLHSSFAIIAGCFPFPFKPQVTPIILKFPINYSLSLSLSQILDPASTTYLCWVLQFFYFSRLTVSVVFHYKLAMQKFDSVLGSQFACSKVLSTTVYLQWCNPIEVRALAFHSFIWFFAATWLEIFTVIYESVCGCRVIPLWKLKNEEKTVS